MSDAAIQHAFVSYAREDADAVDQLVSVLQAASIPVWKDTENVWPGEDWKQEIREAIEDGSLAFIACFSTNSAQKTKTYMNAELNLAVEQIRLMRPGHVWLLPVRLDDCELPRLDLGGGRTLDSLQRIDLFGPKREANLARLVAAVMAIFGTSTTTSASAAAIAGSPDKDRGPLLAEALKTSISDPGKQMEVANRYIRAVKQLGSDKLVVRIGGIYALQRVARDSPGDQPAVIALLAAYVREHSHEQRSELPSRGSALGSRGLVPRPDVQAAVSVIGDPELQHDKGQVDLADADLSGADLRTARLACALLTNADLTGADLTGADLTGATLSNAILSGANLSHVTLAGADLTDAKLAPANLGPQSASPEDITNALLAVEPRRACAGDDPDARRVAWDNWTRAQPFRKHLSRTVLNDADLTGANLRGADLRGASLTEAKLVDATLHSAKLIGANLKEADLTRAELSFADLTRAVLVSARLGGAKLIYANLAAADLAGATLGPVAHRNRAYIESQVRTDLTEANLSRADLWRVDLTRARLAGAKLTGARLDRANLTSADLQASDLSGASLSGADLTDVNLNDALFSPDALVPDGWERNAGSDRLRRADERGDEPDDTIPLL
jgi:uncharacterized protein YjbI with pentapeptide repeats